MFFPLAICIGFGFISSHDRYVKDVLLLPLTKDRNIAVLNVPVFETQREDTLMIRPLEMGPFWTTNIEPILVQLAFDASGRRKDPTSRTTFVVNG
jgi:hypothetical protein